MTHMVAGEILTDRQPLQPQTAGQTEAWQHREITAECCGLTTAQIQVAALRAITFLMWGTAGACTFLVTTSILSFGTALLVILGSTLVGVGALWCSTKIFDYENPLQFARYQDEARRSSLPRVVERHGWNNLFHLGVLTPQEFAESYRTYAATMSIATLIPYYEQVSTALSHCDHPRYTYVVPHPSERRGKWRNEVANLTIEELFLSYDLTKLALYNIVDVHEQRKLAELRVQYDQALAGCQAEEAAIQQNYSASVVAPQAARQGSEGQAEQSYQRHWAVAQQRTHLLRQGAELQQVQNDLARRKAAALEQLNTARNTLTHNGTRSLTQMNDAERTQHNGHEQQYQFEVHQADAEALARRQQITQRYSADLTRIQEETRAALQSRDQLMQAAAASFNQATQAQQAQRNTLLQPIQQRRRQIIADLTVSYRAFVRLQRGQSAL